MDKMKIDSKFMQNIIASIISKKLEKGLGIKPIISFGSPIEIQFDGGEHGGFAHIHIDIDACVESDDISKLVKDLM